MRKALAVLAVTAAVTLVAQPIPAGASLTSRRTTSSGCDTIKDKDAAIRGLAEYVNGRWKLGIKTQDYELRPFEAGCVIQPKGAAPITMDKDGGSVTVSVLETAPPEASSPGGGVSVRQEATWREPTCRETFDSEGIGKMRACTQWGRMDYEGATHINYAFRSYASCGAREGGPIATYVSECYVETDPLSPTSTTLVWNDWSPKSTTEFNPCGSLALSLGVGPVNAGYTVNTCEKLVPAWGTYAPDFRATWKGKSYFAEDVRETAAMVGFWSRGTSSPSIYARHGYTVAVGPPGR
ncbi:hypothetical protein AB0I81_51205 [Nonomuraea sp. NPDC050404]|uniref:hypothetical protein n=1 Tax=Nonomuraea sp. NPDC050404 TaxID=3155783 RepID=UPI003402A946